LLTTVADAWIHQTFAFDSFNNLGQHPLWALPFGPTSPSSNTNTVDSVSVARVQPRTFQSIICLLLLLLHLQHHSIAGCSWVCHAYNLSGYSATFRKGPTTCQRDNQVSSWLAMWLECWYSAEAQLLQNNPSLLDRLLEGMFWCF